MTTGRRGWLNDDPRWSVLENETGEPMGDDGMAGDDGDDCLDPVLLAVARELRGPVTLDAALDSRIMAAVGAEATPGAPAAAPVRGAGAARSRATAIWDWLREPRTLQLSPLGGLAGLAGLVGLAAAAVMVVVAVRGTDGGPAAGTDVPVVASSDAPVSPIPPAAPATRPDIQIVQFVLVAPGARSVALVGDFNDWDSGATLLRASGGGRRVWSVEVPLEPGRHRYAFVVDGEEWVADPAAPRAPGADFGEPSSVITVVNQRS